MTQISYIKYSDILKESSELRIEAEFYVNLNKYKIENFVFGKDIIEFVQYGTSKDLNEEQKGYPILRLNEFDGYYIGNPSKYSDLITEKVFESLKLKKGDVLICRTNGNPHFVGKAAICMEDLDIGYASYLFRIRPNKEINSESLMIYLNSNYGRNEIEKHSMISNQANFSPAKFRQIKIPILPQTSQLHIEEIVKSAHQKQTQSKQLYHQAEELLLAELGLLNYEVKHSLWFTTTKNEVSESHRYDSEYFQPKYDEIIKKIEEYEGGWDLVRNAINFKDKNYNPKDDQKYKYLALSNISSQGYIQNYQEEFGKDLPSRARRKINTNDLIISSIEGSLSSCALVEKEFDNSICSTGFFILNSEKINSETLLILFKSFVIQELLQRGSKGTILTAISKTELESIKIPLIKPQIQNKIAEKIQTSHKLRKESKELLEEAKRKVEEEIKKG
ncbi:restriction endonuclease subunit S [Candidatus Peregrinibacteria bacterium]|nr:MAG: restriction endonuclease subunit S [Candidatus Peregrinibacteria bacterium]